MNQNLTNHFDYSVRIASTIKESVLPSIPKSQMTEEDEFIYSHFLFPQNQILNSYDFSKYLIEFQERENQLKNYVIFLNKK
jgi:hypothetical protein